jgi:ABC-2 type transport system permease protein
MNLLQELRALQRLYSQQFKTTFASMLQYRASLFIWMISSVLEPLIYLVVWSTVSNGSGGSVGGYTAGGFAAYYIAFMLVNQVTYTWIMWEYEYRIRQGSLSFALLKPVHPIHSDISDNLSSKLITLPILLVIGVLLALIFKPVASITWWAVLAFIPALLLAFLVRFLLEWTLALAAFWTTRVSAINQV